MQLFCASQMRTAPADTATADHWIEATDHLNFKSEGEKLVWIWAELQAFCFRQTKSVLHSHCSYALMKLHFPRDGCEWLCP